MNRLAALVLPAAAALLVANLCAAANCGGIAASANWLWTQDARGGGSQSTLTVSGDTLGIAAVEHVHFTNPDHVWGDGTYCFRFRGYPFRFAWKVAPQNPSSGTGLIFQAEEPNGVSLIHVNWWNSFYQWHNATSFRNTIPLIVDANVWHDVTITDTGAAILITLDGQALDFAGAGPYPIASFEADVVPGYVGIGGGSSAPVTYQGVTFDAGPTSAQPTTWGWIKTLFR